MSEPFELTLDKETKLFLEKTYKKIGGTILEFGSGGSTLLALKSHPNNRIYCCETDSAWLSRLLLFHLLLLPGLGKSAAPLQSKPAVA